MPCPDIEDIILMTNIIKDYIYNLDIPLGTSKRLDCPVCGGNNTLSITQFSNCIKYYCFHASCSVAGVMKEGLGETSFTATNDFLNKNNSVGLQLEKQNWRKHMFPVHFYNYLRDNNCTLALSKGLADIRYDWKRDRAVFLVKDGNKVVDAAGRSLDGRNPKWYRYGTSQHPFICGYHGAVVIVEDCASACAISNIVTGVALLGTNLLPQHLDVLRGYSNIFVALDKDATDKAIDMVRTLRSVAPTKMIILKHDLKNIQKDERDDFIRSYTDR